MSEKKPSAFTRLCRNLVVVALALRRRAQGEMLAVERLRALEDRVARLDRGDDSASAMRNALMAVNVKQTCEGKPALDMRITDTDSIAFTGPLSDARMDAAKREMKR